VGEIAPQLIGTKGPLLRSECLCTACAVNSLPLPLSPHISTGAATLATRSTWARRRTMASQSPISGERALSLAAGAVRRRSMAQPCAWPSVCARRTGSTGAVW
jgi:hypothetical protein